MMIKYKRKSVDTVCQCASVCCAQSTCADIYRSEPWTNQSCGFTDIATDLIGRKVPASTADNHNWRHLLVVVFQLPALDCRNLYVSGMLKKCWVWSSRNMCMTPVRHYDTAVLLFSSRIGFCALRRTMVLWILIRESMQRSAASGILMPQPPDGAVITACSKSVLSGTDHAIAAFYQQSYI